MIVMNGMDVSASPAHSYLYNALVHFALHSQYMLISRELRSASAECMSVCKKNMCTCIVSINRLTTDLYD